MANVSICQTNVTDTWHCIYHQGAKLHIYFWYKTPCHQLKHVRDRVIRTEVNVQGVVSPCFSMFFPCFTIMKKHGHGLEHRFQNHFFVMDVIHLLRHIFFSLYCSSFTGSHAGLGDVVYNSRVKNFTRIMHLHLGSIHKYSKFLEAMWTKSSISFWTRVRYWCFPWFFLIYISYKVIF